MKILESVLYAEDLESARRFYVETLGLQEVLFDPERDLFLKLEDSMLIIFKASKTIIPDAGIPPHGTVGSGHIAFRCSHEEIDQWSGRLAERGVEVIQDHPWKNGARSIYFKDPAGNILEFATPDLWDLKM